MAPHWIWQQPDWPSFTWHAERLAPLLRECVQAQGRLMGMVSSVGSSLSAQSELDALLQNIVTSSAIEGEQLNVGSVRSSLARRLGLEVMDGDNVSQRSEGLARLMLDATQHFAEPMTLERLLDWHEWLFPDQNTDLTARSIRVGALRGDDPMQVVSGRLDKPTVHFEAPPVGALNDNARPSSTGLKAAVIRPRSIRCCAPASRTSGLSRSTLLTMAMVA